MTVARKQAGAAATKYVGLLTKLKVPADVADEKASAIAALTAAATAFKAKETDAQFKATYGTIADAFQAFENGCQHIEDWVSQNVPR